MAAICSAARQAAVACLPVFATCRGPVCNCLHAAAARRLLGSSNRVLTLARTTGECSGKQYKRINNAWQQRQAAALHLHCVVRKQTVARITASSYLLPAGVQWWGIVRLLCTVMITGLAVPAGDPCFAMQHSGRLPSSIRC